MAAPMFRHFCPNIYAKQVQFHKICLKKHNLNSLSLTYSRKKCHNYVEPWVTFNCFYSSESAASAKSKQANFDRVHESDEIECDRQIVEFRKNVRSGPTLNHFIANTTVNRHAIDDPAKSRNDETRSQNDSAGHPYLSPSQMLGNGRKGILFSLCRQHDDCQNELCI